MHLPPFLRTDRRVSCLRCAAGAAIFLLGFPLFLAGCVSDSPARKEARLQRAYRARLELVAPGMPRRQLYAVLPPSRRPMARPPRLFAIVSIPFYTYHHETHQLDEGRYIDVFYQLAAPREYPTSDVCPGAQFTLKGILYPGPNRAVASKENPGDIIVRISEIHRESPSCSPLKIFLFQGTYDQVVQQKPLLPARR